jgi:rubrerythrin
MKSDRLKKDVKQAIHEETEAAADYNAMARRAKSAGNLRAAKVFKHIASEEREHKVELRKLKVIPKEKRK